MRSLVLVAVVGCGSVDNKNIDAPPRDIANADMPGTDSATCVPASSSIKARYRAESSALDSVGTYNGVTVGANFSYTPGKYGMAFLFDGVDDAVRIDDGDALWPTDSFTLEAWAKTTVGGLLIRKYACGNTCSAGNSNAYFALFLDSTGKPGFDFRPDASGTITTVVAPDSVFGTQWHHIVGVRDTAAQMAYVYVDGVLAVSSAPPTAQFGAMTNLDGDTDDIVIGATVTAGNQTLSQYFTGSIDEVAIYHTALNGPEIAAIYAAPQGKCP